MIHGSTVTYKSVSRKMDRGWLRSASSMARNSACLVPYTQTSDSVHDTPETFAARN